MEIPDASYRLQFNKQFTFGDSEEITEYLNTLGISHIYSSPIFKARRGSTHGYDIVDYSVINEEIGGIKGFEKLIANVQKSGLGWIQDIVPNHMAFDKENIALNALLENGPENVGVQQFDIDWNHHLGSLQGKLLIPILGNIYAACLENGEIRLTYQKNGFALAYYDYLFPLKIESYVSVLGHRLEMLLNLTNRESAGIIKFLGILYVIKNLPSDSKVDGRSDEISFAKEMLWELYFNNAIIRSYIESILREYNGVSGDAGSFVLLDGIHNEQNFKLSYWKVANEELNYRRFFIINDLISVRVEDPDVFDNVHELVFKLYNQGMITGLRVDHIDGLYDPYNYLKRLRKNASNAYIIVEKILSGNETLPLDWQVQGTTGYEFCNVVNQLFCCNENEIQITRIYQKFSDNYNSFDKTVKEAKRLILKKNMAGDIDNLASLIKTISTHDRWGSDITLYGLRSALVELMIHFPVYRSYINYKDFSDEDRVNLQDAINHARTDEPGLGREFDFIQRFLFLRYDAGLSEEQKILWTQVVMRFQQFTGSLCAKGIEDTVFYDFNRLISLNEVGGDPLSFGITVEKYHDFCKNRSNQFPFSMNSTSTHDSKRGEDVRMRINYLSEIPILWEQSILKWRDINKRFKKKMYGIEIPDGNDEYFFYQTLTGTYPVDCNDYTDYRKRLREYMLKAVREAKIHTAWIEYDKEYEYGILYFVDSVTDGQLSEEFLNSFIPFVKNVATFGAFYSLSQCLLKMTSPGIPDFYQGCELWDLTMVDPDNRRTVDYKKRGSILREIGNGSQMLNYSFFKYLLNDLSCGMSKLFLIRRVLDFRKKNKTLFLNGEYIPLNTSGTYHDSIVSYARMLGDRIIIVVASRKLGDVKLFTEFPLENDVWLDTSIELPEFLTGPWRDCITEKEIRHRNRLLIGEILDLFPCALLVSTQQYHS